MNVSEPTIMLIEIYFTGLLFSFMILNMTSYRVEAYQVIFWPITLLKFLLKSLIQAILL